MWCLILPALVCCLVVLVLIDCRCLAVVLPVCQHVTARVIGSAGTEGAGLHLLLFDGGHDLSTSQRNLEESHECASAHRG